MDNYVVLDIETTGFDKENDRIIELAAVRVKNGVVVEEFECLVDPKRLIPENITTLTGISNNDVLGKPSIKEVLLEFTYFLQGTDYLVGHNITNFDFPFIEAQGKLYNISFKEFEIVDSLLIAYRYVLDVKNHKLKTLIEHFNIDAINSHRALDDVYATYKLYQNHLLQYKNESLDYGLCPKCSSKLVRRKGKFGQFIGCTNYPKCNYTKKI